MMICSMSHRVDINERFRTNGTDHKGRCRNFKHLEKGDKMKLNGKKVDIQMTQRCTIAWF